MSLGNREQNPVVWWINHYAVTPEMPGGTRHYDLGVELVRRGFCVRIFASDVSLSTRKRTKLVQGELYRVEEHDGVEFVWVRSAEYVSNDWRRLWNMLSFSGNLWRVVRHLATGAPPSVVIGSSPHLFAAYSAKRIARKAHVPFLLELRDLWPQALVDMGNVSERQLSIRLMRWLESDLYAHAERFIVLARGSRDYLQARGVDSSQITYVPNGVHLAHFRRAASREEARRRWGFDRFTILYAGAHGPANSLNTVICAAAEMREDSVEFVLVGDGPSKAELVEMAAERGVNNVRFLAPVPKSEIPDLLGAADAGLITLKNARAFAYGISPNKLFDYMAAGLPIICSVPGEMADMVEQACAGIACPPEDAGELVAAARQMLAASAERRDAWGGAGTRYVRDNYCRELLADRLAETVDAVLGRTRDAAQVVA